QHHCGHPPAPTGIAMSAARACTATFAAVDAPTFQVTVAAGDGGLVTAQPAPTCSGGTCSGRVAEGTRLTLTATPSAGHRFAGWLGSADCSGKTDDPLTVTVGAELMCNATFVEVFTVAASANAPPPPAPLP